MQRKKIIELKDVSIQRGGIPVLKDLNWTTFSGENWFILGPNGSGKTTLLEILAGYLWPQEGSVSVMGGIYGHVLLPELRRNIGYVSTWIFDRVPKNHTSGEIVASGIEASTFDPQYKGKGIAGKVKEVMESFSCSHLMDKNFGQISSGEQFKVMLCRALINAPTLLILDEPFDCLDIGARYNAYEMLARIASLKNAPQILLVTHHLEDILNVFTHGMILQSDKPVISGRREDVLKSEIFKKVFGCVSPYELGGLI